MDHLVHKILGYLPGSESTCHRPKPNIVRVSRKCVGSLLPVGARLRNVVVRSRMYRDAGIVYQITERAMSSDLTERAIALLRKMANDLERSHQRVKTVRIEVRIN